MRAIIRSCEPQQLCSVTVHVSTPELEAGLEEGAQKNQTIYNILEWVGSSIAWNRKLSQNEGPCQLSVGW